MLCICQWFPNWYVQFRPHEFQIRLFNFPFKYFTSISNIPNSTCSLPHLTEGNSFVPVTQNKSWSHPWLLYFFLKHCILLRNPINSTFKILPASKDLYLTSTSHHDLTPGSWQWPPNWSPSESLVALLSVLRKTARMSPSKYTADHCIPCSKPSNDFSSYSEETQGPYKSFCDRPLLPLWAYKLLLSVFIDWEEKAEGRFLQQDVVWGLGVYVWNSEGFRTGGTHLGVVGTQYLKTQAWNRSPRE